MPWGRLNSNCLNFEYGANGSHGNDFLIGGGGSPWKVAQVWVLF